MNELAESDLPSLIAYAVDGDPAQPFSALGVLRESSGCSHHMSVFPIPSGRFDGGKRIGNVYSATGS